MTHPKQPPRIVRRRDTPEARAYWAVWDRLTDPDPATPLPGLGDAWWEGETEWSWSLLAPALED